MQLYLIRGVILLSNILWIVLSVFLTPLFAVEHSKDQLSTVEMHFGSDENLESGLRVVTETTDQYVQMFRAFRVPQIVEPDGPTLRVLIADFSSQLKSETNVVERLFLAFRVAKKMKASRQFNIGNKSHESALRLFFWKHVFSHMTPIQEHIFKFNYNPWSNECLSRSIALLLLHNPDNNDRMLVHTLLNWDPKEIFENEGLRGVAVGMRLLSDNDFGDSRIEFEFLSELTAYFGEQLRLNDAFPQAGHNVGLDDTRQLYRKMQLRKSIKTICRAVLTSIGLRHAPPPNQ